MARRTWNEDTISQELTPIVNELGRMPTRAELVERDLGSLWDAMRRRGGVEAWSAKLLNKTTNGAGAPSQEDIRARAYHIAEEQGGGDPVAHWLQAERELQQA